MAKFSRARVKALLAKSDAAQTSDAKGAAFEDLATYIFGTIPGVKLYARNSVNTAGSEEIDVVFWNHQLRSGFPALPSIIFAECKNWTHAVDSAAVTVFVDKLRSRSCDIGVLIAANGVTGDPADLECAHDKIASALKEGFRVVVITREDIESLRSAAGLVRLVHMRLCQLAATGTSVPT